MPAKVVFFNENEAIRQKGFIYKKVTLNFI